MMMGGQHDTGKEGNACGWGLVEGVLRSGDGRGIGDCQRNPLQIDGPVAGVHVSRSAIYIFCIG